MANKEEKVAEQVQIPTCPRNCRLCSPEQHLFCSTKICFELHGMVSELLNRVEALEKSVQVKQPMTEEFIEPSI